jgi:hypothetical protein
LNTSDKAARDLAVLSSVETLAAAVYFIIVIVSRSTMQKMESPGGTLE